MCIYVCVWRSEFDRCLYDRVTTFFVCPVGFLGFLFALMEVYAKDHKEVAEAGFFQGYNGVVWILVTIQVLHRHIIVN